MYRCFVCDTPAEHDHHADCPMRDDDEAGIRDPWWPDSDTKVNVASGEDVVLA